MATPERPTMIPAEEQIPGLRRRSLVMVDISKQLITGASTADEDYFGFMALTFLSKQTEHMVSILTLEDSPDTKLIARSMVEGIGQLLWAGIGPAGENPSRAELWWHFSAVKNWNLVQETLSEGVRVPQEVLQQVQADINQYGAWYPNDQRRSKRPYRDTWHGAKIRQMFRDIDKRAGDTMYRHIYDPYSSWHHWSVEGIAPALKFDEASVTYNAQSPGETAKTLRLAFQTLKQTAQIVDGHLGRGQTERILEITKEYAAWLTGRGT